MSRGTATSLSEIVRVAARGGTTSLSDRELLARFADGSDQAAFAELFRRHSGMVLGVCRRALANVQDAEDACQATFLLLARRANSGRWQSSVANWLYTAARRVAGNARRSARRRAGREKRAAVQDVVEPVDRMTGREFLDALDVELDRLPPAYREPLVLCYLEGLTRDEAAARLGLPPLTVKTRLERGRKRLGDALTKRGCVVGVGLLALAATSPARAAPPRLLEGALAGASRSAGAAGAFAEGVMLPPASRVKWLGFLAVAGACLLGVGLSAGQLNSAGPPDMAMPAPAAGTKTDGARGGEIGGKDLVLKGKVLGVDGKPFAGAKLILVGKGDRPLDLGTSAADGQFTVSLPKGTTDAYLVARAEGFGVGFQGFGKVEAGKAVELRLVKDHPIRGRILDTQGQPVAGVDVRVRAVGTFPNDSLDSFLRAWERRRPNSGWPEGTYLVGDLSRLLPVKTDAEGRFELVGLGAERLISIRIAKAGIADAEYWIPNREGFDPAPYNEASRKNLTKGLEDFETIWLLYGPNLSVIAEAEKPIRGAVTTADTGKGRSGVVVRLTRGGRNGKMLIPIPLSATTDAGGRYEIRGARKDGTYMVEVEGDRQAGYMPCQVLSTDTVGYEPIVADMRVVKGVIVTGRVLDGSTGKSVRGRVMAAVLIDNPYAKDYPTFDLGSAFPMVDTEEDGTFRVVAIPGPVLLMGGPDGRHFPEGWDVKNRFKRIVSDPKYPQYFPKKNGLEGSFLAYGGAFWMVQGNWCKVLDIKPGTATVEQDVVLEPATKLSLVLRDEAGKPLQGVSAAGVSPRAWYPPVNCKTDACTVYDVEPDKGRLVVFFDGARKLAGSVVLKGNEEPPVAVTLRPAGAVKGRLVGADGQPLAGVEVSVRFKDRAAQEVHALAHKSRQIVTGPDGSFVADTVLPGLPFEFYLSRNRKEIKLTANAGSPWSVRSGGTTVLGNLTAKQPGDVDDE